MDRQAFKQRMQNLKSYRENNPGKGYWDWKVEAFVDGGVNDNLIGSYSNHTGTPTMYVPVTKEYESDIANSRNRVLEDINTIPYRNRAEQADKIFGTNYSETYDLLDDLYQHRYFDLPEVQPKDMVASGRLQAKPFAEERFNKTGVGAEPNEFDLWVNTGMYRDPMQLANHEMNHYTDYIISRNIDTSVNNNMLKQLENSLKQTDATDYYRKGTEQKAYMNQLRTMLKQNGDIQNLDEPVSSTLLKKYLDKMSDSDPIKKMFKQHKNINAYTKWFNAIPLLGTTALGANAYFNNNKNE